MTACEVPAMDDTPSEFRAQVGRVLERFMAQNAEPAPRAAQVADFAAELWQIVNERGLPPALAADDSGRPHEMSEAECAPLVARLVGPNAIPRWAEIARQLVKACLYPEFRVCRESYRAVSPDGSCRRQQLARVQKRVSGSHCVDCPYWVALDARDHAALLAAGWCDAAEPFERNRAIYLPEDFRALRQWVRARAPRP